MTSVVFYHFTKNIFRFNLKNNKLFFANMRCPMHHIQVPDKVPIVKTTLYLGILIAALSVISFRLHIEQKELLDRNRTLAEYFKPSYLLETVIEAPVNEELSVRGPAWLVLVFFALLTRFSAKAKSWLEYLKDCGLPLVEIIFWGLLACLTSVWANYHPYPLPTFFLGMIFGWIIFKTQNCLLGFPGLILAILMHIEINLFHIVGKVLDINILH